MIGFLDKTIEIGKVLVPAEKLVQTVLIYWIVGHFVIKYW